jgi:hypothetical protein
MIALVSCLFQALTSVNANGPPTVVVDPEVRQATANGVARVLVELRVAPAPQAADAPLTSGASATTADARLRVARAVLSQLPSTHFSLVRHFETVPFLALEIDAEALRALENMGALVTRVVPDRPLAPARP